MNLRDMSHPFHRFMRPVFGALMFALIVILSDRCQAQQIFRTDVWIQTVKEDTTYTEHRILLWGTNQGDFGDLCFELDRVRCYIQVGATGNYIDDLGDEYWIRIIRKDGLLIFISSVCGYPSFTISSHKMT